MKRPALIDPLPGRRALVLVGVALGLCLSEGVGLRLLPLPVEGHTHHPATFYRVSGPAKSSRAPSPGQSVPGRTVIAAPELKRSLIPQQVMKVVADLPAPAGGVCPSTQLPAFSECAAPIHPFFFAFRPADRAPPVA